MAFIDKATLSMDEGDMAADLQSNPWNTCETCKLAYRDGSPCKCNDTNKWTVPGAPFDEPWGVGIADQLPNVKCAKCGKMFASNSYANQSVCQECWPRLERIEEQKQAQPKPTGSILDEALAITSGERRRDYDAALPNHQRIADLWNAYIGIRKEPHAALTPEDVAVCMILLKLARHAYTPKRDNMVDIAGYARCIAQIGGME